MCRDHLGPAMHHRFSLTLLVTASIIGIGFAQSSKPQPDPPQILEELRGKIIGVADGDTLTLLMGKESVRVRLEGIDAPERGQNFSTKSRDVLKALVVGKEALVQKTGTDEGNKILGIVIVGNTTINAEMVEQGWAWYFEEHGENTILARLEQEARAAKRGLWADANPLPPWEFRERRQAAREAAKKRATERLEARSRRGYQGRTGTIRGSYVPILPLPTPIVPGGYWLNTSSGVRHNPGCEFYSDTKNGRPCGPGEGRACQRCGG